MSDVSKLSSLIDQAMTRKDMGVNALSRAAQARGLQLSSSTISLYRRGQLPKNIPSETLDAFAQLLDIPKEELYQAAYGDDATESDIATRASLAESLAKLPERQQKLVRQIIYELAREEEKIHEDNIVAPAQFGIAARDRRDGDPDPEQDGLLDNA